MEDAQKQIECHADATSRIPQLKQEIARKKSLRRETIQVLIRQRQNRTNPLINMLSDDAFDDLIQKTKDQYDREIAGLELELEHLERKLR